MNMHILRAVFKVTCLEDRWLILKSIARSAT